jgi:hypothetical protein
MADPLAVHRFLIVTVVIWAMIGTSPKPATASRAINSFSVLEKVSRIGRSKPHRKSRKADSFHQTEYAPAK